MLRTPDEEDAHDRDADAPPDPAASWPPGLPRSLEYPQVPVGSILRAAVRRWGDRDGVHRPRRPADLHRAGRAARTPSPAGWPTTASAAGTSSPSTSRTAGSTRRSTTGSCWPGRPSPPPTRCCRPPTSPPSSPTPARRVLITWDQVLPFVRGALAATPVRDGRSSPARRTPSTSPRGSTGSRTATSTPPTCSPPTPPTGTSTPTSTRPPTSRTSPTPAARPASARASSCRTATSSPTCCSRPAGRRARCRSSTRPAT